MADLTTPPTEVEIAEVLSMLGGSAAEVIRRLAFQRDKQQSDIERLNREIDLLHELFGRSDPVRCKSCDQIRERAEVICGHCTYRLDGSDLEEGEGDE